MALFFLIIVGLNFLYLLPLKAERVDSLPGCGDRNCATNPTDAVIANDSTFILIVDSSPFPFIRRFDFNGTVFNNSTLINLKENNPNKIPLKIGLNKNNNKSFVYKTPSGTDKGSVQIINLTNNSVKLLISPTSGGKQLDSIGFIDPDGKKLIACVSDSKNSELLIIDIDTDTVESNVSLPDKASSIAVSTNFTKAVIAFKSTFSQSIGLYDIQSGKIIRLDTPINIFFKIDDFIARDDFDLNGNISVLSTVSGAHALSYLNLKENNLTVKILDKNTQGQSIATISRDGTLAIVAGAVLNSPTGFRIYKIDLTNSNFPIITEASFSDGTSVIDVDITPDQNKVILLLKKDTGKILRILNINDFSKISDVFVANDNSKNVLAVDPRGNFAIAINQNGSIPASIITDFAAGPIIRSITPNFGSINGGTLFTIDGLLDLNRFTSKDVKICFKDLNTCASSVEVSADGRTIKGITPKMEKEGIENIILVAESKVNECSSTEKCVSCSEITCTQGQTKTTGTCCECPKCIYNTSTYKDIFDFRNDIAISDTIPPKIKITKPTIPIATNKKEIKLEGEIDGTGSPVETLTINNESTKTTQTEKANIVTFSANLKFEKDNSYLIKLSTKDKAGNLTEENIEVIVDTVEPKLLNIKADRTVNGDFNLSGTADGTGSNIVKILINNVNLNINPGKLVDFSTTTNNSPAILKITDAAGNVFSTSVNILNGTNEPIITFLSPKDSNILKSRRVIVKGTVDGNNSEVKSLTINNSNTSFTRQSKNKVIFSRLIEFNQDGLLDITAIATNKDNLTATRTIMVRIDSVIPSATASAEFTQDGKIKVSGSADGTGSNISSISVNNVQAQFSQTPTSDFSVSITPSSSILLTIIDAAGNRFSQQVPFSEKIPPAITITTPSDLQAFKSKSIRVSGIVDGTGSPVTSVLINNIRAGFSSSKQPLNSVSFNGSVSFTKDGSFDVTVSATDKAGNSSNKPIKVIIDSVIPSATASAEFTQDGKIKVSGSADGTGSNISSISVNNVQAQFSQTPTSDFSVSITPSSSILLTIIDAAGNRFSQQVPFSEKIPPAITITTPSDLQAFKSKSIRVSGIVDGTGSPVTSVLINNIRAGFSSSKQPLNSVSFNGSVSFTKDGSFDVTVSATDKAGNSSNKPIKVIIDSVIPSATASAEFTQDGKIKVSGSADGTGSNISSISVNNVQAQFSQTPTSDFSVSITPSSSILLTIIDAAGNINKKNLQIILPPDIIPPIITLNNLTDLEILNSRDIKVGGLVNGTGSKIVLLTINGNKAATTQTNDPNIVNFTEIISFKNDGLQTITIAAKDKDNNSSKKSISITIDTVLPDITSFNIDTNDKDEFVLDTTLSGTGTDLVSLSIKDDKNNPITFTPAFTPSSSFSLTAISPTSDTFIIEATDKAGNKLTKTLKTSGAAPTIDVSKPFDNAFFNVSDILTEGSVTFSAPKKVFKINDTDVNLSSTPDPSVFTFKKTLTFMDGTHTITFLAKDKLLRSSSTSRTITIDTLLPIVNATVVRSNNNFTINGSAEGTGSNIIIIEINGNSLAITEAEKVDFNLTVESPQVSIKVKDKAGNETTKSFEPVDQTPPKITINAPKKAFFYGTRKIRVIAKIEDDTSIKKVFVNEKEIDLTNTSGNNSGKRMSYQITNNPNNELKIFNLSVDEVINTEGNTKIKITAIDTSNNQSEETIDFIVDSINPEFNVNVKPESGGTYTVSGSANGTGSKIISIEINGQSIDITPDAVINFSGTADKTPLTVRVFDSAGNQTEQTINAQLPDTTPPNIKIISPNNGDVFTDTTNININFTAEDNIQLKEVTLNSNNIQPVSEFNYSANVTLLPGDNLFTVIATDTSNNTATSTISISYSPPPPRKSIGGGGGGGGGGGLVLTLPPPIISPNTSIFEGVLEPVSNNELPETVEVANPPATRDGKKADISIVPTVQGLELKRTDDNLLLIPQGCSFATIIKPLAEIIKITDEELNNKYATILIDSTGRTFLAGFAFFIKSKQDIQSNEPIFISSDDTPLKLITTLQIPPEANEGNTRVSIIGSKGTLATINIIIETDIEVKTRRRSNELDKPKIVGTIKATIKKLNNKFTVLILKIHADNLLNKIAIIDGKIVKIRGERNSLTRLSFIPEEGIKIKSSVLKNKKSLRTVIKLEDDIELGIKLFNITTPKCADIGAIIIPKELNKGSLEASDNPESLILEDFIKAQNALSEKKNKQVEDKEESIESEIDDEGEYLEEFKNID